MSNDLLEYSVVYTDRSLNHMSEAFQKVMNDLSTSLKEVYNGYSTVIVPGGGTYAMEAVARQFARDKRCMVIRNGWFSFRWSQIFDKSGVAKAVTVLQASAEGGEGSGDGSHNESVDNPSFAPPAIETVVETIRREKPEIVFAPHVETASGIILPNAYVKAVADAVHEVGGVFVLDCIASGTLWVDMEATGVDVLISAPQKGWSASPCAGLVILNEKMRQAIESTESDSFACDLRQWLQIMEAYEKGGHAYHATMPTDSLRQFRDTIDEIKAFGLQRAAEAQQALGDRVRALLAQYGIKSVAAEGFGAPGVVVSYTGDSDVHNGKKFRECGLQIAAGVPLRCDEPENFKTFRIGLFGLDKLANIDRTVERLETALKEIFPGVAQ